MKKFKNNFSKRILAMVMALLVVLGTIPLPTVALAAEEGKNHAVSIVVTDGTNPIEGAEVRYALAGEQPDAAAEDVWQEVAGTTDADGKLAILAEDEIDVIEDEKLWIEISYEGYTTEIEEVDIYSLNEAYEETVVLTEIPEEKHNVKITVSGGTASVTIAGNPVDLDGTGEATVELSASDAVAYTITPGVNRYIKAVEIDGVSIDAAKIPEMGQALTTETLDVSIADVELVVEIGEYYSVSASQTTIGGEEGVVGGTITLNGSTDENVLVDIDESVELRVEAEEGYIISGVKINGSDENLGSSEEFTATLEETADVEVTFTKKYTVTVKYESANGEVVTDPTSTGVVEGGIITSVVMGTDVKITATPQPGYRVEEVKVDGVVQSDVTKENSSGYEITINTDKDYVVEIVFAHNQHTISVEDTENGQVSVDANVESGDDVTVTITPDAGYTIDSIIIKNADDSETPVNNAVDNEDGTYSFVIADINENKTVVVVFKEAVTATDDDFDFEFQNTLRKIHNRYFIVEDDGAIVFSTEKEGIRVYTKGENGMELAGGDATTQQVTVDADAITEVVKIQVYFKADSEMAPAWHDVASVTATEPIKMVVDTTSAEITHDIETDATDYGYYKENILISVGAIDDEQYSGIASITYFITNVEIAAGTKYDNVTNKTEIPLYTYDEADEVEKEVADLSIEVNAQENNSQHTKVWIKVVDRAGNVSEEIIDLPINTTKPEIALSIIGEKNSGVVDSYFKSDRVLTITITDRADTFLDDDAFQFTYKKDGQSVVVTGDDITWQSTGNTHVGTYTFTEEAKYVVNVDSFTYTNKAGLSNESVETEDDELNEFYIDKTAPGLDDIQIVYPEDEKEPNTDRYYNDYVDVEIIAVDNLSGIKEIRWKYIKTTGSSAVNKESDTEFVIIASGSTDLSCSKVITLPKEYDAQNDTYKQLNGYLVVEVVDHAGHVSLLKEDNGQIFVVDNKLPIGQVEYTNPTTSIGTQHYYDGNIDFIFNINEANFDSADVKVYVSKDGAEKVLVDADLITWTDLSVDEHKGTYTISGDGDYVLYVEYEDKSGNAMESYQSDVLTIDTVDPVVNITFDEENQKIVYSVTENNFRPQDIVITGTIVVTEKDAAGNLKVYTIDDLQEEIAGLAVSDWTKNGDVYTYESDAYVGGYYDLSIGYKDIVEHEADEFEVAEFFIDHTAPVNVTISYSESIFEKILEAITFGFYKASVTVTFTAYDDVAGVEYFTWNYTKENGASTVNRETDATATVVDAVQDADDHTKYTATVVLPATDVEQLRGYLAVVATDARANDSVKVTDAGRIIVVDNIAPTMQVEYSLADKVVGDTSYYNNNVEVTFIITEANFYKEAVQVMVSKDGGAAYAVTPQWTDESADKHVGKYVLSGDGDYVITVNYTDYSTNVMAAYTSKEITIDTVKPVISVKYANTTPYSTLVDAAGKQRKYFANKQTATITIKEHNFDSNNVVLDIKATDVAGNVLTGAGLYTLSTWKTGSEADTYVLEISYPGDANYTFDISYADLATNAAVDYAADYFTVDKSAPTALKVTYSTSVLDTILEAITFGFYNAKVDVTIVAEDATSGVYNFAYSYIKATGVSEVNTQALNQAIAAANITYTNGGKTATAKFQLPKEVVSSTTQFNGTVSFEAIDRAGLKTNLDDDKRIVVDNIAPKAEVTYNEPVTKENGVSYYNGDVDVTVVITEANFYAGDVEVTVSKDGGAAYAVTPSWRENNVNLHTGTFTLEEDGDYVITINYRDKSSNEMTEYVSEQLTIDTDIQEPTIMFNGNNETGNAYKGDVVPEISFSDINYDSYEVFLYRTYMNEIDTDITAEKGVRDLFTINEESGSASLNIFAADDNGKYDQNDDGIYRLVVKMADKSGHTSEKEVVFTVNRYGSVYAFNEYLVELIADGGAYVTIVTDDLVITEYNADQLVTDSLNIEITRDGKPLEDIKYTTSPTINENVAVGESGWYQYEYVISRENFLADGIYKISISSKDATGNAPENSNYEDKNILFRVDSTVPEIVSIAGLEEPIVNDTELKVRYTIYDAIGLKSVKVYVDGEVYDEVTDFSADYNNYEGNFTLKESEAERAIRVVVEDMAGNITDTDADDFSSAYEFNSKVTVTTNALVRFMANKPLFYGSIAGVVGVAGLAGFGISRRFRKRAE